MKSSQRISKVILVNVYLSGFTEKKNGNQKFTLLGSAISSYMDLPSSELTYGTWMTIDHLVR